MYTPNLGRWMTVDPIGYDSQDTNLYRGVSNNPINLVDPFGLHPNDDKLKEAANKNKCKMEFIDLMLKIASETPLPETPLPGQIHNKCEQWVDVFINRLHKALNDQGHKSGLNEAMGKCLKVNPEKVLFFVDSGTPQDHTAVKLTFNDGSVFYIDCGTIAAQDINRIRGGPSHVGLPSDIPSHWKPHPYTPPVPPPAPTGPGRVHPGTTVPSISGSWERDLDRSLPGSAIKAGPKN